MPKQNRNQVDPTFAPAVPGSDGILNKINQASELDVGPVSKERDACVTAALACRGVIWNTVDSYMQQLSNPYYTTLEARSDTASMRQRKEFEATAIADLTGKTDQSVAQTLVDSMTAFKKAIALAQFKAMQPSALSGDFSLERSSRRVELTRAYQARGAAAALDAHVNLSHPTELGEAAPGVTMDELLLVEEACEVFCREIARQGNAAIPKVSPGGDTWIRREGMITDEIEAARLFLTRVANARQARVPEYVTNALAAYGYLELACGFLVGQQVAFLSAGEFGTIMGQGKLPSPFKIVTDWSVRYITSKAVNLDGYTPLDKKTNKRMTPPAPTSEQVGYQWK